MHELSLCQAIVDTVRPYADGRELCAVHVRVGHLRQVVPDSMQFAWEVLTAGTGLEGCALDIEHVPAVVECRACAAVSQLDQPLLLCPRCGGADVGLRSGEELDIASVDLVRVHRQ